MALAFKPLHLGTILKPIQLIPKLLKVRVAGTILTDLGIVVAGALVYIDGKRYLKCLINRLINHPGL